MQDCYNEGDVTGGLEIGGIVGYVGSATDSLPQIKNCYNNASVMIGDGKDNSRGGIVGKLDKGNIEKCYYKTSDEDSIKGVYGQEDKKGSFEGKKLSELENKGTFEGWDFESVWKISTGETPYLEFNF